MQTPFKIVTTTIQPCENANLVYDMTGQCAFAVCVNGDFDVKIMNKEHRLQSRNVLMCMPFINVELLRVRTPSEVIFGGIALENMLSIINRTIATGNLLAIRQHPITCADTGQIREIRQSVNEYLEEIAASGSGEIGNPCSQICQAIIDARSQLIVAQLLKLYFTNMPMNVSERTGQNHRDMIFQNFMLDLYGNFRSQRNVSSYALRSGLSVKYFSTVVRELSGASPSEWIETVVVGEAKSLLVDPHRNIKEIAASLNFPDASTFTKYFQRVAGMTPKKYRQSVIVAP